MPSGGEGGRRVWGGVPGWREGGMVDRTSWEGVGLFEASSAGSYPLSGSTVSRSTIKRLGFSQSKGVNVASLLGSFQPFCIQPRI